jgi:hypothetical protein
MAKNNSRPRSSSNSTGSQRKSQGRGLFSLLDRLFDMNRVLGGTLPVDYLPHLLWATFLTLIYIGCSNNADHLILKTEDTRRRIAEKRAEYISLKSSFMKESKQSEVAKRVEKLQLKENQIAPRKIIIKPEAQ